jgi:hypothetical protein
MCGAIPPFHHTSSWRESNFAFTMYMQGRLLTSAFSCCIRAMAKFCMFTTLEYTSVYDTASSKEVLA